MEKIKYGLSNVHYAVLTDEEALTYGEVKAIKGAVNLALSAEGDKSSFFADNINYFSTTVNNGFSGDLEIALIPDEFLTDVLGYEKDETTGLLLEVANALPKPIALMFQFENDTTSRRVVLFKVTVGRPGVNHSTKTEGIEPQTDTLTITVSPIVVKDKTYVKGTLKKEDEKYETFFEGVVVPNKEVKKEE